MFVNLLSKYSQSASFPVAHRHLDLMFFFIYEFTQIYTFIQFSHKLTFIQLFKLQFEKIEKCVKRFGQF